MKKLKKIMVTIFISIISIFMMTINTRAITPTFKYACSRGVCVYYYIDGGNNNTFYTLIKNAANNWEHTDHGYNPIYLYEKSSNSGTAMDFFNKTTTFWGDSSILGETYHRNGSGARIDPNQANWLYSEIYLNTDSLSELSDTIRQGTIGHEMGHAFGLAHYNNNPAGSIMCQLGSGRSVHTVQQEDNDAINAKYGN